MLHEILFALLGYVGKRGGGLIVERTDHFGVADDVTFIDDGDKESINRIVTIGYFYKQLCEWLKEMNLEKGSGVYLVAMCTGLDELLGEYRHLIASVEQNYLKSNLPPSLTILSNQLQKYDVSFRYLWFYVMKNCGVSKVRGTQVLSVLYDSIQKCGIPHLRDVLGRLFFHCMKVFYNQISAWIVHGILVDPENEFFIAKTHQESSLNKHEQPSYSLSYSWIREFVIIKEKLPCFISTKLAETILFVGKATKLIQEVDKKSQGRILLNSSEVIEAANSLESLSQMTSFQIIPFEHVIECIRFNVAKHLWELIVKEENLLEHLRALKDYFLIARGDFYQCFINDARQLMQLPPRTNAEHDLNIIFQQTATKSSAEDDEYFTRFRVRLASPSNAENTSQGVGWGGLSLDYKVDWPLDLLLSNDVLQQYNGIFQLLFMLKRVQTELSQVWADKSQAKNLGTDERSKWMPFWLLRQKMTFFVDNLMYYFQVDVLEIQYASLRKQIVESQGDFEGVKRAHNEYLSASSFQCFLHMKSISRCMDQIFQLCFTFCACLKREESMQELTKISEEFDRQYSLFYTILLGIKGHKQSSPQLAQLILTLDYNKSYSKSRSGLLR